MATLIDSYAGSSDSTGGMYYNNYTGIGQTIRPSSSYKLTSCKFSTRKNGSPTGTAYARVYSCTGTFGGTDNVPTGNGQSGGPTALAVSDGVNVANLSTTQGLVEMTFSGANQITLQANTVYAICWEWGQSAGEGDSSNHISLFWDSTTPTHAGSMLIGVAYNRVYYYASASGSEAALFEVYGDPPTSVKTINGLAKASVKTFNGLAIASVKTINGLG